MHAFDDDAVIAGQGTIGLELLDEETPFDAVVVPVGGGGLIGGIAVALKSLRPGVRIIGVEPAAAASMRAALAAGGPVDVAVQPTLADGLAVRRTGERTFAIARELVDEIVTVSEGELASVGQCVAAVGANILEVQHNRAFADVEVGGVEIDLTLETRGHEQIVELRAALAREGIETRD